jgi:hypothetical protein
LERWAASRNAPFQNKPAPKFHSKSAFKDKKEYYATLNPVPVSCQALSPLDGFA